MTNKDNVNNLNLDQAIAELSSRNLLAKHISFNFDNAICSIFLPNFKGIPEQIGTGVLINIQNHFFIFSAAHVFEEFQSKAICIGLGNKLFYLRGERLSSPKDKPSK